jgi:iron complex transport system permease protein
MAERGGRALCAAAAVLAAALALGVLFGSDAASLADALAGPGHARSILFDYRLKQVLLAAVSGGGLAVVGGAFQALLRNPLADPYILGVSGGAALGATTVIAIGLGTATVLGAALTPLAALAGGLLATGSVYWVAQRVPRGSTGTSILLAGVMVNSICASLITFGKLLVTESRAQHMLRWLVGFVELPSGHALTSVSAYVLCGVALLLRDSGRMNLLALGDESAASLGVEVTRLERRVFLASSCVVGAIVSLTGLIGFVGLVVPHAVRRLSGPDHRQLLPVSLLLGGAMLVLCDLGARLALGFFGTKLPVGAVTAVIGGPTFLYLLTRTSDPADDAA